MVNLRRLLDFCTTLSRLCAWHDVSPGGGMFLFCAIKFCAVPEMSIFARMKFKGIHRAASIRFRRWSRKRFAAFASVGRHVTIGHVCKSIAEASLDKTCSLLSEKTCGATRNDRAGRVSSPEWDELCLRERQELLWIVTGCLPCLHSEDGSCRPFRTDSLTEGSIGNAFGGFRYCPFYIHISNDDNRRVKRQSVAGTTADAG